MHSFVSHAQALQAWGPAARGKHLAAASLVHVAHAELLSSVLCFVDLVMPLASQGASRVTMHASNSAHDMLAGSTPELCSLEIFITQLMCTCCTDFLCMLDVAEFFVCPDGKPWRPLPCTQRRCA